MAVKEIIHLCIISEFNILTLQCLYYFRLLMALSQIGHLRLRGFKLLHLFSCIPVFYFM